MTYYYNAESVRNIAEGNWLAILDRLGPPALQAALAKPGRHVQCPVHGTNKKSGKGDGFRLFGKDAHLVGGGICNTCGPRHDGFELLMWTNGWNFEECLRAVGDLVGADKIYRQRQQPKAESTKPKGQPKARGSLINYGTAPFNNNPKNEESFFVTVLNRYGRESTFWGVDLKRALEAAKATEGDEITLNFCGRQSVTVSQPIKGANGEIVDTKEFVTHRNEWQVLNHSASAAATPAQQGAIFQSVSNGTTVSSERSTAHMNPEEEFNTPESMPAAKQADSTGKVIPLFQSDVPAYIKEAQERLERQALSRKTYGAKLAERHQNVWDSCLPIIGPFTEPLRRYFEKRGFVAVINDLSKTDSVRFHPALPYFEEKDGKSQEVGKFPALVAIIRDVEGNMITLHRIYLSKAGNKASVAHPKKMMPIPDGVAINGGSIQVGSPVKGILGVAEGLETGLAAWRATGIPVWSTINAQLMQSFIPPEGTHTVLIWADLDRSATGQIAANVLKARLEEQGINVLVLLPSYNIPYTAKSLDWNDVLLEQGRAGFPSRSYILRYCEHNSPRAVAAAECSAAFA